MSAFVPSPIPTTGPISITGPLSIPQLLDRTFRAMRARFGVLTLSAAMVFVPIGVATALLSGTFMTGYGEMFQYSMDPQAAEAAAEQMLGNMFGYFGSIFVLAILSLLGSSLVMLMSIYHIQGFLHGENTTIKEGWMVAIRRLLPLVWMQILQFLSVGVVTTAILIAAGLIVFILALIFGGALSALDSGAASIIMTIGLVLVLIIGYILLFILMLAPTAFLMGRWIAAAPSLLVEDLGPVEALKRSWALTKGRVWRALIYIVLLTVLSAIVIGVPATLVQLIATIAMPSQMMTVGIISTAVSYLLNLFYQPFYATSMVLYYYDLRVRDEAYDVALRVAALEAEVAPDASPA